MMTRLKGPRLGTAIVIFAVALIPLLYAGLLTMTYQNPTNRLDDMTAAIVNEDQAYTGTLVTGKQETFSLGHELTDALVHPKDGEDVGFSWEEMSESDALAQMNDERVRAILYIPHDFSKNVAKIGTDIGSSATQELRLVTDDGVNYLAGTMAKTVSEAMTNRINERGATRITERLLVSIEKIRGGLHDATDGSTKLADGTVKLNDGVSKFDDGIGKLSQGTRDLSQGTGRLVVGMNDLANGTVTLRNGLATLDDGTGRAADGSQKLSLGLTELNSGVNKAASGSSELHNGAEQLAQGVHKLNANTDKLGAGVKQLADGSGKLAPGIAAYTNGVDQAQAGSAKLQQAAQALPGAIEKMSAGLGQAGDFDPTKPETAKKSLMAGTEALNAGLKQLRDGVTVGKDGKPSLQDGATQLAGVTDIVAESLKYVDTSDATKLAAGTRSFDKSLHDYTTGIDELAEQCKPQDSEMCQKLKKLSSSSQNLREGSWALVKGADSITGKLKGFAPFTEVINTIAQGAQAVKDGVNQVAAGSEKLAQGSDQLTQNMAKASAGVGQLKTKLGTASSSNDGTLLGGINDLSAGLAKISGVNGTQSAQLRDGAQALAGGIGTLTGKLPELTDGVNKLDTGAQKLADGSTGLVTGMTKLSEGSQKAASSAQELASGIGKLKNGTQSARSGSQKLADGAQTAQQGVGALDSGARKLNDGAQTAQEKVGELADGARKLNDGATKLRDGLTEGSGKIPQLSNADQQNVSATAGKVAEVKTERLHAVANNGAGFTPMFMSLALWIGTIALFLVLPALDHDERARGRWIQAVTKPAVTATILAVVQAVVMMVVVNAMGELHVANLAGLSALAVLASICFMAVNQACVAAFAFRGRFLSIVLLSLQITSMGATFPIETAPKFFQWIHWLLPMSDTQLAFRSLIAGGGVDGIVGKTVLVLLLWTVVAVAISFFASKVRTKKNVAMAHDEALAPTAG
ncbi:YhgE/Pip domain-containing protein [Arcanobacterium phocae]|uniref:YhgE/Pip domain-containing protein n=2 Tax=Arcanobacterium phocae TaxID=131112 RepID=UPI001C0EE3B2|nr:YhgE/Pip domain-containing protein [Arcanobacterium phocae]